MNKITNINKYLFDAINMSKKYQGIFVRLLPTQHKELKKIQERDGITITQQIRMAVSKYLRGLA